MADAEAQARTKQERDVRRISRRSLQLAGLALFVLRAREVARPRPIVVLANLENDPTKNDEVEFFRGDPSDEADLLRAGIDRCAIAIVLADESTPAATDAERDARTLFTVLAVETVNADAYSRVEAIRSDNRRHFANTHANELVISGEVTGALLAGSAANPRPLPSGHQPRHPPRRPGVLPDPGAARPDRPAGVRRPRTAQGAPGRPPPPPSGAWTTIT